MTDKHIIDVLAWSPSRPIDRRTAGVQLAALRDAGYDVVPTDTARLGRAVQKLSVGMSWLQVAAIYAEAGVERP